MKNKTELVFLVDRSGSMASIKQDMEGGLKTLIEAQKKVAGECSVTYYQFDSNAYNNYEKILDKVYENRPINEIGSIVIDPRGGTPLHDAVCLCIDEVGARFAKLSENERPERVLMFVISDGEENSSRRFTGLDVKNRVEHQQNKYAWKIEFLGTNFDAVSTGSSLGFNFGSTMTFSSTTEGINNCFNAVSNKVISYRTMDSTSYMCSNIDYTDEERKDASK